MFDSAQEAIQKLAGCLVFSGETPVWCDDARQSSSKIQMSCSSVTDRKTMGWIPLEQLDIQNLGEKVGYFNFTFDQKKFTVYGRRSPVRRTQSCQGLSNYNVRLDRLGYNETPSGFNFTQVVDMGGGESLSGKYPGVATTKYQFAKNSSIYGLAFDKTFAVIKGKAGLYTLYYKGQKIGWTEEFDKFRVEKQFRYLDEDFDRLKIEVRS